MKTRLARHAPAVLAVVLAGCAATPETTVEYDRTADFGKYRTYGFVAQAGAGYESLNQRLMQTAAARELEARGYSASPTPDLLVNFHGRLEEKMDVYSTPSTMYGPAWGYGAWRGARYGGWSAHQQVSTDRYKVGTLVIDLVDRDRKQAVFQGSIEGEVTAEMLKNREAAINTAVARIFAGYPYVAGQSQPAPAKK